jgi:hypothetical protein
MAKNNAAKQNKAEKPRIPFLSYTSASGIITPRRRAQQHFPQLLFANTHERPQQICVTRTHFLSGVAPMRVFERQITNASFVCL